MHQLWRQIDQWLSVGDKVFLSPTDVDKTAVHCVARGEMLGGPDDGATFEKSFELRVGSQITFGPLVTIALVATRGSSARFAVLAPDQLVIKDKEPPSKRGEKA